MDVLRKFANMLNEYIWQYLNLATLPDLLDVAIVAYLLYRLIKLIKNTTAARLLKGFAVFLIAMQAAGWLQLNVVSFLFRTTMQAGLLAVVVVFQPELRKMLEQVGKSRFSIFADKADMARDAIAAAIVQTVDACSTFSWTKTGALIVFERGDRLTEYQEAGTVLDARLTAELVRNVFYPKAPLHDGAIIVRNGRVAAAGCVLPLSKNANLSRELGTRHRAAVGMSEAADAMCVVVSEETGSISVAFDGMLKRHVSPETLQKMLEKELLPDAEEGKKNVFARWLERNK